MDPRQEREVAQGLNSGDADAWRALYDAYAEPVWRVCARLMGGSTDVADVVQETFVAAAQSAHTYDSTRGTIWYWLCGIARRHVALFYRKQERHDRWRKSSQPLAGSNGRIGETMHNREPLPAESAASAEMAVIVRTVLAELSDDYGTLLAARYLEETPVEQLAQGEESTETAIRSKLARARRAFREAFQQLTGEHHDA